jgi:hypothetical protein
MTEKNKMKKWEIWTSEVVYKKYIIEAETKDEAVEIMFDGNADEYDCEYDNFQIDSIREVGDAEEE